MNREERRAAERYMRKREAEQRSSDPEAYFRKKLAAVDRISRNGITPKDMEREYRSGYEAGSKAVSDSLGMIYTCAMMLALHELHGFGRERLIRVADLMCDKMTGYLTDRDAMMEVFEKLGLKFFKDDPFHPLQMDDGKK